jgi:hypothetical protein
MISLQILENFHLSIDVAHLSAFVAAMAIILQMMREAS